MIIFNSPIIVEKHKNNTIATAKKRKIHIHIRYIIYNSVTTAFYLWGLYQINSNLQKALSQSLYLTKKAHSDVQVKHLAMKTQILPDIS